MVPRLFAVAPLALSMVTLGCAHPQAAKQTTTAGAGSGAMAEAGAGAGAQATPGAQSCKTDTDCGGSTLKYCGDARVFFQEQIKRHPKSRWTAEAPKQLKLIQKNLRNKSVCAS